MKKSLLILAFSALFCVSFPQVSFSEEASSEKVELTSEQKKAVRKERKRIKKQQKHDKKALKEASKENKYLEKRLNKANNKVLKEEAQEQRRQEEIEAIETEKKENPDVYYEGIKINPKTGFPEITQRPFVMFNEGVAFDLVTRLQKNDDRSNFVWQDYLIGAFFEVQTENMRPLNSIWRISAFYPFMHTFNGMEQAPKQTILYAFDLFGGPMIQTDMWKYVRLNFALGPHYMYQLSDEYHLNYLGGGVLAGIELPVARHWTITINGTFTLDYANLGTNKIVQPFDYSWQYHAEVGVRYSKRNPNKYAYIHKSNKPKLTKEQKAELKQQKLVQKEQKAQERKEKAAAKKEEKIKKAELKKVTKALNKAQLENITVE